MKGTSLFLVINLSILLAGCDDISWNNPYPHQDPDANILYTAFSERPKHLDPARSYSSNEWEIISQIYEPPLQYAYLKRPYTLQPQVAQKLPQENYNLGTDITVYTIKILPEVNFQPHPAFVQDLEGNYIYHNIDAKKAYSYRTIMDFTHSSTREVTADDFVYQIKRLADPKINSPIYGFLSLYIVGLEQLRDDLIEVYNKADNAKALDLRNFPFAGAEVVDKYTYKIYIKGKYPQFKYWLAMPFFAPVPWEATVFYSQDGLVENNINLDWYPIGTGPYYLIENNPERRMVLNKNPNYRLELYPLEGEAGDQELGLLVDAGQKIPFIDKVIFSLEKESIPYWNKFLQGYYDKSGISSDNFFNAISISGSRGLSLTPELQAKNISLQVSDMPTIFYWAFNMLDDVVGGYTVQSRKLRKAISLAFDIEEYISIFLNGRGSPAAGPIPPGIEGYKKYIKISREHALNQAKQLLIEAGYANGIDPLTNQPLQISYETISSGDPNEKSLFAWIRKQLDNIGIDLIVRATDYNRFQDKMRTGNSQMFAWGWNADYPDPENFLFMFYGPNGKVHSGGENSSNYSNEKFDNLFTKFRTMEDSQERQLLITEMVNILEKDTPWIWGYHPQSYALLHEWNRVTKPNGMARNTLKYAKVDPKLRAKRRLEWNKPLVWPIFLVFGLLLIVIMPAIIGYKKTNSMRGIKE